MLAARAIFTVAIRPAEPPRCPEGAGQRKAMRMPPPVCALGDRGRAQRAARRLQEAFSWSAHHQIAKQLGSPTPSQGEEGGVGETGVLLCFCASAPQCTAPVGLAPGARPTRPLSTPRSSGSPASTLLCLGWLSGPSSMECKALRPSDLRRPVLGKWLSWGSHLAPAACRSHSGNHLPHGPCLTTYCASSSGQMDPCPYRGTTLVEEEAVNKEART